MLEAAVQIVAERGLDELTLAECGEAAGYSRGLAAHYFGSKDGLISVIAQRIVADYWKRVRAGTSGRVGLEGLLESVGLYIDSGRDNVTYIRALNAVLGSALTLRPLSESIAELNRQSVVAFAAAIRRGVELREIRSDVNPEAQGVLILGTLRGVMTQWLIDPQHIDLESIKAELLKRLRRELAP